MAANRTRTCAAFALVAAMATSGLAAKPAEPAPGLPVIALADTRFQLADGAVPAAAAVPATSRAVARERAGQQAFSNGGAQFSSVIAGPSWSYQTSRTGPLIEMGALGGGVVADRPRLAHVAFAWQF